MSIKNNDFIVETGFLCVSPKYKLLDNIQKEYLAREQDAPTAVLPDKHYRTLHYQKLLNS